MSAASYFVRKRAGLLRGFDRAARRSAAVMRERGHPEEMAGDDVAEAEVGPEPRRRRGSAAQGRRAKATAAASRPA